MTMNVGGFALRGLLLAAACVQAGRCGLTARARRVEPGHSGQRQREMLLQADTIDYDTNSGVATARGHVEIDLQRSHPHRR